jgi:hypothetical protein
MALRSFRAAVYCYLAKEQEVSQQMHHVRGLPRECLPGQEDMLWLLVVQHVLVGSVGHREDVRCIVRPGFEAVLAMEL